MNLKTFFHFGTQEPAWLQSMVSQSRTRLKRFSKDTNVIKTNTATSYSVIPVIIIHDCTKNQYLFSNWNVGTGNSGWDDSLSLHNQFPHWVTFNGKTFLRSKNQLAKVGKIYIPYNFKILQLKVKLITYYIL